MAKLPVSSKKFKVSDGTTYIELCQLNTMLNAFWQIMPCAIATTTNLTANYTPGTGGVGAYLNPGSSGALMIDGVTPAVGARVLVKNQTSAFQNGIYSVFTVGDAGTPWQLNRTTDFDSASQMIQGIVVAVFSGTANALSSWMLTSLVNIVGTDALNFGELDAAGVNSVSNVSNNRIVIGGTAQNPTVDIPSNPIFQGQYIQLPVVNSSALPSASTCAGAICVTND